MPWNPSDLERIRKHLNIPIERMRLDILRQSMARIEADLPEAIATVQELLTRLDSLRDKMVGTNADPLTSTAGTDGIYATTGYALVKADELEWDVSVKTGGFEQLQYLLRKELADALLVKLPEEGYGAGLYRS